MIRQTFLDYLNKYAIGQKPSVTRPLLDQISALRLFNAWKLCSIKLIVTFIVVEDTSEIAKIMADREGGWLGDGLQAFSWNNY